MACTRIETPAGTVRFECLHEWLEEEPTEPEPPGPLCCMDCGAATRRRGRAMSDATDDSRA
jgi:hypothetical protein